MSVRDVRIFHINKGKKRAFGWTTLITQEFIIKQLPVTKHIKIVDKECNFKR